jgi:hypothetical protein
VSHSGDDRQFAKLFGGECKRERLRIEWFSRLISPIRMIMITNWACDITVDRGDREAPDTARKKDIMKLGQRLLSTATSEDGGDGMRGAQVIRRRVRTRLDRFLLVHIGDLLTP